MGSTTSLRIVSLAVLLGAIPSFAQSTVPEVRAMWMSRFDWADPDPVIAKARIDSAMQDLADHNFNTVYFQVRGQADVFYPSPHEPWSPLIGGTDPGWDPLAYALAAAHARGLKFHAYINTHTCWQSVGAHEDPKNGNHLFFKHCRASDPNARDWLIHDSAGNPVQWHENDYVWIAPGVPAYQAYIRKQVLYVVENYDVDGVHFDRIRTPNSSFSYDPISEFRRANPQSNPFNMPFTPWTADQITRMVCDIYAAIMAVKPHVEVSAAVFADPNSAPTAQHQDAATWALRGGLDVIVPMMYSAGGVGSTWDTRLQTWLSRRAGRHVVAGHITTQGLPSLLEQITLTRTRGAHGNSVFSWGSYAWWDDYLASVYQQAVPTPVMPWKQSPTTGIVYGYVTDANGEPVVDARVSRTTGIPTLSSGDGFYALLLVSPGTQTIQAQHVGYSSGASVATTVAAGEVIRRDIVIGQPLPPVITEVTPDPEPLTVLSSYSRQLVLAQGLASSWTLLEAPEGATLTSHGKVMNWRPTLADAGRDFVFCVRASSALGSDDEEWTVHVQPVPPCDGTRLTDFDTFATGGRVMFNLPSYSGSTVGHLASEPNVARVTDVGAGVHGTQAYEVRWQFIDTWAARWMRLTTHQAPRLPNPTVLLHRPIRVRLRVESGRFRLSLGVRETGTAAEVGQDGGTAGAIEWIGATGVVGSAPQGKLIQPAPGVWQTIVFDPLTDPIRTMTGDGVLASATGKGVLEQLAFSIVDTAGPFEVYIDDVDQLCSAVAPYGDFDADGYVDLLDFATFLNCRSGPTLGLPGPSCSGVDADHDGDVDQDDFGAFQRCYSGPRPQLDPACGR